MSGGMNFHINHRSDSAKAKASLDELAKMDMVKKVMAAGGAELQKATMRNMTQKYTGHQEGKKFVGPTGTTKRSVELHIEDSGLTVRVTVGTDYFGYLEKGTRFMLARPTLKPAFDATKTKIASRLGRLKG